MCVGERGITNRERQLGKSDAIDGEFTMWSRLNRHSGHDKGGAARDMGYQNKHFDYREL